MPATHLFEYAVIRVVPRVEREEFLNVGVVLYCRDKRFLKSLVHLPVQKMQAFGEVDIDLIQKHLHAFENICGAKSDSGPIGRMDVASRFRWLTGTRSTIIQTSRIHPGLCEDPETKLRQLFGELVG